MARALGLMSGLNGETFSIAMRNIRVRSVLTESASGYDEDGKQTDLAAVSRRTELNFDGLVDGETMPEAGGTIVFHGRTFLIRHAQLTAERGRFQRYAVKAERSDEAEVAGF